MASVSLGSGMILSPTSVALATQDNYVSALTTAALAMHKRDVDENFVKRYGNQGITGLLELVGAKKETTQTEFSHYEEAFIHNSVLLTSPGSYSGTSDAFVYAAEDDTDAVGGDTAIVAGTIDTPVRANDILLAPSGDLMFVQSVAANGNPTLSALDGTPSMAVSTQGRYSVVGNMHGENSDQPGSLMPRVHTYTNKVMIMKESFVVSGTEATNVTYFKVDNEKMGSGYLWYLKGEADTYKRFLDYCELQLIIGQTNSNTGIATTAGGTMRGTEGLLSFIESKGQSMDLGSASITMADFDAMVKSLDKYRGAKEMALYAGIDLSLDIDELFL